MDTKITFINKSFDRNNSHVVIYQKNVATGYGETSVAWKVIENCGYEWSHTFNVPTAFEVLAEDSFGNVSNQKKAINGQKWEVVKSDSGDILQLVSANAASSTEVEVKNSLSLGSIDTMIYKEGRMVCSKTGVSPGEKSVFEFQPYIYVGVNSRVEQGDALNSAILSDFNTKFCLAGIEEANLIMTGGGVGKDATPFKFDLVVLR